jgi:hypothetical protein
MKSSKYGLLLCLVNRSLMRMAAYTFAGQISNLKRAFFKNAVQFHRSLRKSI